MTATTTQLATYLYFKGDCESALAFYQECVGGQPGPLFRYAGSPLADTVPADWQHKIMHGTITVGGQLLMVADVAPERYEKPSGFSLSLQMSDSAEAERVFGELARSGRVVMPLERTFWAARFGVVVDRFGIQWIINCEGADQPA